MTDTDTEAPQINADFSLEDEYKEDPLAPQGQYFGNLVGVVVNSDAQCIEFKVVLAENGGVMSDGETPVDGSEHYNRVWLPKPGDEDIQSKGGKGNKRQTKINMMKTFADGMKINMDSPKVIMESIDEGVWVGISVVVKLDVETYEGVTRNVVKKMVVNPEG